MIYLFDTSAIVAHYRGEKGAHEVQGLIDDKNAKLLIASVSLVEFSRRLDALGIDAVSVDALVADYQSLFEVVPVTSVVALAAIQLGRASSKRLPLVDALIAASAAVRGAMLVHRDEHFAAIPTERLAQLDLNHAPA